MKPVEIHNICGDYIANTIFPIYNIFKIRSANIVYFKPGEIHNICGAYELCLHSWQFAVSPRANIGNMNEIKKSIKCNNKVLQTEKKKKKNNVNRKRERNQKEHQVQQPVNTNRKNKHRHRRNVTSYHILDNFSFHQ